MLQDMANGRLENEFRNIAANPEDIILCFHDGKILLSRGEEDALTLPTLSRMARWQAPGEPRYLFRMEERNYFLWTETAPANVDGGFCYEAVRPLRQLKSKEVCYAIMTGWHLYNWYRNNRLCGSCGTATVHDSKERMLRCPNCKKKPISVWISVSFRLSKKAQTAEKERIKGLYIFRNIITKRKEQQSLFVFMQKARYRVVSFGTL